ncbi:Immunoglobulin I-set domain protein [Dirofilaria immitis]|nr:Immunoglobulin I-set domain protein [Dirofilaria immitis]
MVLRCLYIIELTGADEGGLELRDMEVETISELDVTMSDVRSEFSEYSTISRSLFGPEEGPPRKKIKSPPVISPTASTTSLYSGGSSSIDWTTTGTTLDMQGTRVTRTQYGFRTLQESSAKMCLKVTGYPLPEISWYKDDQILHEDERHTFYADEDGFFALTIDPVQVDDTGRYTCMATNEYGQASTSAFFKVLKVEKEAAPPAFVTTLQDQEVKEGEMVSFECEVEGWPEPELVWLVDEQPLRPSHDFKLEYDGQNAKLEIRDAQPEDTGVYTVRIKNEYGTAESNAKLKVEPDPDKNHIAPEFQMSNVIEGDTAKFKAILTGDPNPDVIWMINGVPLSESDKIKFISEDGICILTITDVSRHFDGTVTCQGVNRLGTQHCDAQLKVQVPPSPPNFEHPLDDKIIQEEQTVILETEISGFPDPVVSFTINGKPIISGENGIEIIDRGNGCYRIEILRANTELHDGEIVCTAINEYGQAESRARIIVESIEKETCSAPTFIKDIEDQTVKYGEKPFSKHPFEEVQILKLPGTPGIQIETQSVTDHKLTVDSVQYSGTILCRAENLVGRYETKAKLIIISDEKKKHAPEFIEKLIDTNVMEGSDVVFEVRVEAEPAATLKWFLGEKELIESERVKIREFDGSWKLEINKLTIEESGIIRCVAENSEGTSESSANLTVNKKPYAPQFKDRPKNVTIEQGQEAQFEAQAIAVPEPVYQWSIDGRKIKDTTEGAKVEIINDVSILTVDTKIFDSSTISVTATNSLGVDETGALLTVQEKQVKQERTEESTIMDESGDIKMPMIKKGLEDQNVKLGEMADFEVSIEPNEVAVEWYCNGKQLIDEMPGVKISQQNFNFKLTVDSARYAGIITFKASNKAGKAESSANLIAIQEKIIQKAPEFLNTLDDISATERDKVEITIESTGKATFEWALNEKILQSGVENVTIRNEESKSILIFEKVSLQQAGKIKVVATNEGGQAASSFIMTIKEGDVAPEIITGPNSLSIKENDAAEFRVEITGKPKPTVKWLLNGRELSSSDANIIIKSFEEIYTLKIEKANLKHAGELVVTAENAAGVVGKEVILKIEPDLTKPVFKTHLIDRSVNEGEPLRWDVSIERPYKGVTVKWFLNGKELTSSENVQIIDHGEGKYHVTINEAKADMTGTLVVKATNSYGTSESHASVEVKEIDRKPEITRQPQDHIVEESQTVKFSAIIFGKPTPTVSWYMDGMKLENNNEVAVKFDETTGKTSIKIFKSKLSDSGKKITLKVENAKGQTEATALLTVNKKSEPPNILTEMKSRQVNEGETASFSVKVAGYPPPEVTWFRNGEPIIPDGNTKITEEDGTHTLILNDVTPEQSGEISCEAKNSMGSKKQLATLTVKPTGNAPFFERNIQDKLVVEGEELIMDAKLAEVKPSPTISWLKDGKPLKDARFKLSREDDGTLKLKVDSVELNDKSRITIRAENRFGSAGMESLNVKVIITGDPVPFTKWYINDQLVVATEDTEMKEENGVYSLTIHGCTKNMTGTIKCVAYNKAGEATVQGNLTVLTPIPVEFETSLCDAVCREGDTLKLKAVLMGEPTPEESQNIKIHAEKGTYTVTIRDITCDYSGKVVCEAVNEYGKAVSEASLLVLPRGEPPDFIEWLSNVKARQGSKVTHKVVFTGDPKPNLTWYINNEEVKDSDEITIVTDDNTSTLVIKSFNQEKHTGEIICKAENDAGEVSCTASMGPYTSDIFSESQTESEAMADEVLNFEDGAEFGTEADSIEEMQRTPTPIMAPKFITKIKDTRAARGHQAVFECVVPDTKGVCCKWLKDGREIELIARIRVQTRTIEGYVASELIIDNVMPEDAGKYTVVVENVAGKDSCEATLNVIEVLMKPETSAPEFVVAIQDKTCKEAEKVIFECKVISEPEPTITWFHEKTSIVEETNKTIIESDGTVQRLVIVSADVVDRGQYICLAENVEGKAESKAILTVLAEAPQFTRHITSKEGSIRITSDSHHSIEHDISNVHWRLVIEKTEESDFRKYRAVAINSVGMAESEAEIRLKEMNRKPELTGVLKNRKVTEGDEIIMEVKFSGIPQPDVKWFKDSKEIVEEKEKIVIKTEEGQSTLIIKDAKLEESGSYHVELFNSEGREMSSANVTVESIAIPPQFTEKLTDVEAHELETIEMKATATGIPTPQVQWFKDGALVQTDSERIFVRETETNQHILTIKQIKMEDAGVYSCKASNKAGVEESKAEFVIQEVLQAPKFIQQLSEITIKEIETAELAVTVTGKPIPEICWTKDGAPINIDNIHYATKKMRMAKLEDAGIYSCKASNKVGEAETRTLFAVEQENGIPQFLEGLKELSIQKDDIAELSVTVVGKPAPEVVWYKDGIPVNIDNEHIVQKDDAGRSILIIKEARLKDTGVYSCKATNIVGTAETEARFAVEESVEMPKFIEGLQEISVQENETAQLSVTVVGKPEPEDARLEDIGSYSCKAVNLAGTEKTEAKFAVVSELSAPLFTDEIGELEIQEGEKLNSHVPLLQDCGTYVCVATNQVGTAETIGKINFPKYGFERMREEEVKPIFIEPLEVHTAKEGETITITCRVNENARADIQWFVGDKPIESNEHLIVEKLENGIIKLTIENATKEDVGVYRCEAINKSGKAATAAKLNFASENEEGVEDESALIGFFQPLCDVVATDNSEAELTCALNLTKRWFEVPAQRVNIEQLVDGTQKLKIAKVTAQDVGTYRCTASIGDSSVWTEGKLTILETTKETIEGEGPPEFIELLKSCTVIENAEVILQCKLKGLPRPTISWMKDGIKLEQNHRVITEYREDGTIVLKIKNARKEDSGEYRCDAVNKHGAAWTAGPVRIVSESELLKEGEAPDFIQPIKPVTVTVGETAILEGKVTGQPEPEVKWFSGENMVKETSNIKLENLPDGTQRLTIKKATIEDAGNIVVSQAIDMAMYGVMLHLPFKNLKHCFVSVPTSIEGPTFLKTLGNISTKESEHVVFECKIVGEPMPEIKWFKETLPDGTARLIIDSVNKDDAGEFRCEAQNAFGTARTDAILDVLYGFEVPVESENAPEFAQELKAIQATEGQKICFECRVVGVPTPEVKWFKDGEEIKPNEHVQIESLPDGTNRLLIDSVNVEDQGNYRCEATNNVGSMSSKAPLTVNGEFAGNFKAKKGLTDARVEIGSKIRLSVEVEGKPKIIKWFHGKDEIKESKRTKLEVIKECEYSLETDKAENSDEGTYRVVLSTDTETVESSCTLTVFKTEMAPTFRKGLQDQSVPKGSKLVLEIELDGTPKEVKWLKNGLPVDDKIMKAKDLGNGKHQLVINEIKEGDAGEYTVQVSNDAGTVESKAKILLKAEKPEIVSGLKPTIAEVGEKVTLEVETKGPIKQVKWYKNGAVVKNAETKKVGDNRYQLIIDEVTKNDEAEYKVVLSNDEGDADSAAKLTVKLPKIAFTKSLEDQTVNAGTRAILTVEVNVPPKQVKWYKNGEEITPNDKAKANELNDNTYQLMIPDADKDDIAEYKVILSTEDDTVDSFCALTVKLPALIITKALEDQTVNAGEKYYLMSKLMRHQNQSNAKPKKVNDMNYQLEISSVTKDDAVDYKVVLSNGEGSVESNCTLTVRKPAEKPTIKKGIEDQFIAIGRPLEIAIKTTGEPKIVKWYKNGQILSRETTKTVKMETIDENNYILKIEESNLDDSGTYSIEVQNEAGQAKSSGEITVEEKLSFLKPLQDVEVVEAEQAIFMVETNVHPRIVKWYKNGQEIKLVSERIETKDNATKFQLIIKKAEINDAATYKVILSNSAGDVDSSANLTVKKSKGQPKIIKGLEDQVIAKGDELILEIKIDGEPTEVRWLKNGITLGKNVDAKIKKIDEQLYRLTIPRVDTTDAGTYSVEVINEVGKVQSSGDVEVDVKPEIVKGLEDNEIEVGDEQSFKVETNMPIRDVKWYKNGQEIKPSPKLITKQITSKKFELLFTEASLDDTATYKVTLSNKAGACDSSASLTVAKSNVLKVLDSLKDVEVNEGEPIKLSVKVEGQPKTVKWLKNGQEIKPDDRMQITENPEIGEYTLMIPESLASDDAAYRVMLSNARGEVQSGSITRVKPKKVEPVASGATFVTPLEDVDVPEGDNLTLKCKVSGEPMPTLKWYKNGVEIAKDDRVVMRIALNGTATLRRYSVSAINSAGESKSECNVRVLDAEELPSAPKFTIPLRDIMAEMGTKAEFNIKVRGIPKPTLQWSVANEDVSRLDGIKIEDMGDGNWIMIIENVIDEFIGRIKCIATNEHGKAECESQLIQAEGRPGKGKIEEGYPPKFNVPLWDRRISEGQVMTIECHVDAKPTADIVWTKDGIILVESDRIEIRNTPDGACRLRINSFGEADVGTYKCAASNAFGVADTKSNLSIQGRSSSEKEFPPRFNPPLMDKYADIDETIRLSCKVDASPKAAITWYKDGVPLRSNGRVIIENDDNGDCLLTINHSTESDDGAYRCVAINDIGSSNSACMVSIRRIKEEVKRKGLVDKWLERGDKLTLKCTVIGDPKPEIRWYRNGILLRPTNKINIENMPDGLCTLTIEDCAMSDEGIYRCDAENSIGKARTQSTVHIERPVEKLERKIIEGEAPRFVIPLQDITVYAGSTIDLECKVIGEPMPTVKWSKDGMVIRDDPRYQWEIDAAAGIYQLKIIDVNMNDEGAYRCVATNAAGSATTKAFVRIDDGSFIQQMPSSNEPPRFTIAMGDARAIEGQPLKFECKIEGAPLTDLIWYKDGERIIPDDRIKIESDSDGRACLIINSCNASDEGLYRVIATNPFGTVHSKGTAMVKKLPKDATDSFMDGEKFDAYRAPRVIVPLESIKIMEGNGFTLRCKFSGDPRPKIKWFKDGERVYSYDRCTLTENEDGTCELTVKNANRFDGGCYRCVAENIYGSDRTTCEVVVQLKEKKSQRNFEDEIREGNAPGFSVPLAMKRVKSGDTVILECIPYGKPFPEIKWLKDGIEIETSDKIKIESLDDKTQRIILKDVDFFAEGFYRCVATNEYGTASTKGEVALEGDRILLPKKMEALDEEPTENKPRIRRGLYNMSVHQGNTIEMQVCTSGWPTPNVKWFKNGQELKSSGPDGPVVLWTDERGIHHCVILNASPNDEAEYALEATNKLGMARTEGAITIIRPREVPGFEDDRDKGGMPYPPGFIRQLKNKHVFSHMPTIFDCLVVGYPPPEVEWFHNGKRILPGDRIRIQSCGGGSHALIIMGTLPEDAGEYVAIAKNSQGQASSSAVLDVTGKQSNTFLDSIKFDGSMDVTPYLTEEYGFKKVPHHNIPTPPDRGPFIKEVTGHYLTLSWIPTKRAPPRYPQVTYVIEIRELPEKDWVLLDYNIPEPVCKVRNLQLGKSYQFRVRAENIYGISDPSPASPPSRLMAPPQPVLDKNKRVIPLLDPYTERALDQAYAEQYACAPWFAPGIEEKRFCAENEMLSITLHVSGYPDPNIVWKFRNMNLDTGPTSRIRVLTHAGTETTLIISGFSKENVGQYQCIAINQYGEAQQNIYVDLGARPRFIQPLINKVVPNGKALRLDDWRPIVESSRITFVREGLSSCSLIINDPFWCDCGIYSVAAINDAGTATTSCSVTIEEDGDFSVIHEIRKKKPRIALEARKVREIYEIDENDEKYEAAAAGAPFHVTERATNKRFLAQLRELDENLARNIEMQNNLDHPNIVQLHQAIMDQGIAVLIYENVNRSLLDSLISSPAINTIGHIASERQVQIFIKQLLCALKCMHDRKIAHLDIRPEVILLQDDHLRLADFGQSRRLVRGKVTANIMGSPEFISPEIAAGIPVTLASDLWSVGTLTYVLLSGISPFLGDNDTETVRNVMLGNYALDIEEFGQISNDAKDFVSKLLVLDPRNRLNVNEALHHPWLSNEFLENAPITSECLREFKYKHKWLERRVFVQQTPSEQLLSTVQFPNVSLIGSTLPQRVQGLARSETYDIYDYLRIKDRISPRDDIRDSAPKRQLQPQEKDVTFTTGSREHRAIEEEIANRILSDISEETSITGSIASHDDLELQLKMSERQMRQKKSRSKSSTPQVEGFSLDGTPIASPIGTGSAGTSLPESCSNIDLYRHPIQLDPSVPVGAPLFLEGLEHQSLVLEDVLDTQSPQSLPSLPGTKSPILLSPIKEYTMGVIIGTKQGTKGISELVVSTPQFFETEKMPEKQKAIERKHEDEFENIMNEIEAMKEKRRKEREEMERLRPKNIYEEIEFKRSDVDDDEFPWESQYQIGPETLLLATRGAGFNARVRDYRRELWGDGAPLVNQGYLGYRNQDITVRERRRFTDLVREDENIAKSVENLERDIHGSHFGAIRRIRCDINKAVPVASKEDGTFGAIFRNRLKDIAFVENNSTVIFKCAVIGNPQPTIEWFFNESLVVDDCKHKIFYENGLCQLTIHKIDLTDLGEYTCVASNEHGIDRTCARLIAGDTPARPGRPEIELSSDTEVFISWEAPQMSHALECFMYRLEVRLAGENDHFSEWRLVSDKVEDETAIVRHLTPQGIYQFRVIAKNEFGWGSPKLQIEKLQSERRVCVVTKPPKTRLISKSKNLGEITEEDEEKCEAEEIVSKMQTRTLVLNTSENPEKRFQLIAPIPRGRFGKIAFAIDTSRESGIDCIAKIRNIAVEGANNIIEFEAMKECQQENVVRLIAAYQCNKSLFLFMERYQEDIFERFTYRDTYNEEQISRVVVQIASALHWIHFRGYVHMDVQATNVLFASRQSWQIKLTDFASAQKLSNEIKQPSKPNLYWASPEMLRQTDIWGLGIITFCLLSGFHPFASEDDSDDEIKESVIYQKCNPNLIQIQASQESLKFVTWALKKDPMKRIRTDEALTHRWLSMDSVMRRRRETINYPSSRLRKTAILTVNRIKDNPPMARFSRY